MSARHSSRRMTLPSLFESEEDDTRYIPLVHHRNSSLSITGKSTGKAPANFDIQVQRYRRGLQPKCFSPSCRQNSSLLGWGSNYKCYSRTCPYANGQPKRSYWDHPKIKRLMTRAKLCTKLGIDHLETRLQPFSSFAPRILHDYLTRVAADDKVGNSYLVDYGEVWNGAVLFADASGFGKLTELLSDEGAEKLCHILNEFFTHLLGIVHNYGGDVIKFAGDAITVVWPVRKSGYPKTIEDAAQCASRCSMAIHKRLHKYVAIDGDDPVLLSLHIGVGCGQLTSLHLGGVFGRWEFVVGGPPMTEIGHAEPSAEPGETVVAPSVWDFIKNIATATPLHILESAERKIDDHVKSYMRLDTIEDFENVPVASYQAPSIKAGDLEYLRRYIPFAVHKRLEAGHDAYIAECRPVSILFMQINGFKLEAVTKKDGSTDCTEAVQVGQELILKVQEIVYHFEGSMNKMMIDDKGQVILCVWGLNPYFHHDDPSRAVKASLALLERFQRGNFRKGVTVRLGISSGHAFCGVVGSKDRCEYTVMGDVVNMAARLMCAATEDGILVDDRTKTLTKSRTIQFDHFGDLALKGMTGLKSCFSPSKNQDQGKGVETHKSANLALEFRTKEIDRIDSMLQPLQMLSGTILVIVGDRGSGKEAVAKATIDHGYRHGYKVFVNEKKVTRQKSSLKLKSAFDVVDNATANFTSPEFTTWVPIFRELVKQMASDDEIMDEFDTVEDLLEHILESHPHHPLLSIVLPELRLRPPIRPVAALASETEVPPTPMIFGNQKDPRKSNYWDLDLNQRIRLLTLMLAELLEFFANHTKSGTLVVLHLQTGTSHKLISDPESWTLAQHIADFIVKLRSPGNHKLVLCIVSRPSVYYSPNEYVHIQKIAEKDRTLVQLKPLSKEDRLQYIARYLHVNNDAIPNTLADFVSDMGAGNPKHIEEILQAFESNGTFSVKGDRVILSCDLSEEGALERLVDNLPKKTTDAALTLIERLQPRHQLIVKISSMWSVFSELMLRDVIPESLVEERAALHEILSNLVDSGILQTEDPTIDILDFHPDSSPCGCYSFVSKVVQRKAAGLMLKEHHQELDVKRTSLEHRREIYRADSVTLDLIKPKMLKFLSINTGRVLPGLSEQSFEARFQGGAPPLQRQRGFRIGITSQTIDASIENSEARRNADDTPGWDAPLTESQPQSKTINDTQPSSILTNSLSTKNSSLLSQQQSGVTLTFSSKIDSVDRIDSGRLSNSRSPSNSQPSTGRRSRQLRRPSPLDLSTVESDETKVQHGGEIMNLSNGIDLPALRPTSGKLVSESISERISEIPKIPVMDRDSKISSQRRSDPSDYKRGRSAGHILLRGSTVRALDDSAQGQRNQNRRPSDEYDLANTLTTTTTKLLPRLPASPSTNKRSFSPVDLRRRRSGSPGGAATRSRTPGTSSRLSNSWHASTSNLDGQEQTTRDLQKKLESEQELNLSLTQQMEKMQHQYASELSAAATKIDSLMEQLSSVHLELSLEKENNSILLEELSKSIHSDRSEVVEDNSINVGNSSSFSETNSLTSSTPKKSPVEHISSGTPLFSPPKMFASAMKIVVRDADGIGSESSDSETDVDNLSIKKCMSIESPV